MKIFPKLALDAYEFKEDDFDLFMRFSIIKQSLGVSGEDEDEKFIYIINTKSGQREIKKGDWIIDEHKINEREFLFLTKEQIEKVFFIGEPTAPKLERGKDEIE